MSKNLEKEKSKVNNKRKRGVSLIALVITIIVIIILAAIVFFGSTGTVEKANYAKFTTNISEVESEIREKALSLKGDEASKGKQLTDGQIYNYVAKGGKTDSDYLNEDSTPKYTIIDEASNINLPEMRVNTPTETGVKIIYAVTDEGEVFVWPPYGYDNEYYVTGSEKVDKDKAEKPGAGDIDIKIDDNVITIKKDEDGKIKNDDGTSTDEPDVPTKIKLTKPSISGSYIYNGNTQTVTLSVFDSNTMTISGNTRKDAGSQEVTVSLKDTSKYEWTDGTASAVVLNWTIAKKSISVSWSNLNFEYDGANHVPTATLNGVVAGDTVSVNVSGTTSTEGEHTAIATLTGSSAENYELTNTTTKFTIIKTTVNVSTLTITLSGTSFTYTGAEIKPTVTIKNVATTLSVGTDYTLSYSNNINAGTATITIKGSGKYVGTITKNFTIERAKTAMATASDKSYTGSAQTGVTGTNVDLSGTTSATNVGTYTATATPKSNYAWSDGTTTAKTLTWKITEKASSSLTVTLEKETYTYDGTAKEPAVTVKDGSTALTAGTHYTVSYNNNINAGTATVTITMKGNYSGTITKNFTIERAKTATASASDKTYTGSSQTGVTGTNVDLSGTTSATNVGTYTATATPKANYAWSDGTTTAKTLTWKITEKASSSLTVTLEKETYTYDGTAKEPAVTVKDGSTTLTAGTHFIVAYSNNINAGTATATITMKGNYTGTITKNFTIERAKTASATVSDKTYNGSSQTGVTGTNVDLSGTTSATNVGTYTATATPKANYAWSDGTTTAKTLTWKITEKASSSLTVTLEKETYTYDGTAKEPAVTVKDGSTTLTLNTHYAVAYSNNTNAGTATVTITMKGNYSGTITKNFTIERAKTASATASDKTYNGSAQTGVTGTNVDLSGTTSATNVGTYTATATPKANYAWSNGTTTAKTLTWKIIEKASSSLTVILEKETYTYDGTAKEPAVTVKDGSTILTLNTHYTVAYSNNTNAGTATATITMKDNYTGTITKNFTIERAKTASATASDKTYNGSAQTGVTGTNVDLSGTTSATNVGTYTATATPKANYAWSDGTTTAKTLTWKIAAKTLTVTPTSGQAKIYGTSDNVLTYTYAGQVSGQTPAFEGALARETGENVGTYAINKGTLALKDNGTFLAKNYTLALGSATVNFTINKKQVSAEWGSEIVFIYDGKEHAPTVTIPTGVTGETINVSITGKQINASDTAYTATVVAESVTGGNAKLDNYEVVGTTKEYTISKREVMVVWSDTEIEYTGEILSPAATADSKVEGETITLAVTGGETAPGTHTATASIAEVVGGQAKASNYNLTNTSIEFEITKHLKVGDYVNYVPTSKTLTTDTSETGADAAQTLTTTANTKWRILSIDEATGEILLTAEGATNKDTSVSLGGAIGYLHGAEELNRICKELYSSGSLTAKSMTLEDLNKAVGYDPSSNSTYGTTKTYTTGTFYTYEEDGKTVTSETPKTASSSDPVTVKNTLYIYDLGAINTTVVNILGNDIGWLASSCVYNDHTDPVLHYKMYCASSSGIGHLEFCDSYFPYNFSRYAGLRPVISLSSKDMLNLDETGKDGLTTDTAWNIIEVGITGEEKIDSTLTLDTSKIPSTYTVTSKQWYSSDTQSVEDGTAIENATGDTYKVELSMAKKYIYVVVKATAPNGTEVELKAVTQNWIAGLAVGDYVNYVPTSKTITTDTSKTGADTAQTLTTTANTQWRIFSINETTGEILLTTQGATNTDTNVTLKGATGYLHGAEELNRICKELYSSGSLVARSMTVEDINKAVGYDPTTYNDYGKEYTYTSGILFYTYEDNGKTVTSETPKVASSSNPVTVKNEYYNYNPSSKNSKVGNILGGAYGWLASPCVYVIPRNLGGSSKGPSNVLFDMHYADSNYVVEAILCKADSSVNASTYGLHPVVSVNRSLLKLDDESKDGLTTDTAWELSDLKIGDYVNYVPTSKTITTDTSKTGYSTAQTLTTQSDTEWRVFNIDWGTGEVLLTTQGATNVDTEVYLDDATGYLHGVEELNRICKELYSSESLTARSMTIEDINEAVGYDPATDSEYCKEYTYTSGTFYTYEENGKTVTSATPKVASSSNPITVKNTFYTYNPSSKSSVIGNILGNDVGWLASTGVYVLSKYKVVVFGIHNASSSNAYGDPLWIEGMDYDIPSNGLHPVVSINAKFIDVVDESKDGTTEEKAWNIYGMCTIAGSKKIGRKVTSNIAVKSDEKIKTIQWYINDKQSITGGTEIEGATKNVYEIEEKYLGKYIYFVVTIEKDDGTEMHYTSVADKIQDKLVIGDYVNYIPTSNTVTTDTSKTGYDTAQTLSTQTNTQWRILSIDEAIGEILLTTQGATNTDTKLTLKGATGYLHGAEELNRICKELYSSTNLTARSMTVEDLDKAVGYEPTTSSYYGEEHTYTSGTFYTYEENGKTVTSETPKVASSSNPMTVKDAYYSYNLKSKNSVVRNILGTSTGWLASPCVDAYSNDVNFDMRYVSPSNVGGYYLYDSSDNVHTFSSGLRPVISINANLLDVGDESKDGTTASTAWNLK